MAKRIPEPQKLLILADAIATSAPDAAKRWGVSDEAIYKWTESLGGLRSLRELYELRQLGAVCDMAAQVSHELRRRLPKLSAKSLTDLAMQVIAHGQVAASKGGGFTVNLSQQQAQAQQADDDPDRIAGILRVLSEAGLLSASGSNGAAAEILPAPSDGQASGIPDSPA